VFQNLERGSHDVDPKLLNRPFGTMNAVFVLRDYAICEVEFDLSGATMVMRSVESHCLNKKSKRVMCIFEDGLGDILINRDGEQCPSCHKPRGPLFYMAKSISASGLEWTRDARGTCSCCVCSACGRPGARRTCSGCAVVHRMRYCNEQCQRAHWKLVHRKTCPRLSRNPNLVESSDGTQWTVKWYMPIDHAAADKVAQMVTEVNNTLAVEMVYDDNSKSVTRTQVEEATAYFTPSQSAWITMIDKVNRKHLTVNIGKTDVIVAMKDSEGRRTKMQLKGSGLSYSSLESAAKVKDEKGHPGIRSLTITRNP
jgi:hypothetical protein